MPRRPRVLLDDSWSHVTIRSNNRERFDVPLRQVWDILDHQLFLVTRGFNMRVGAMVLMPNHVHLLVYNAQANLDQAMGYLLKETSKEIGRQSGRINHIFGNRFFSSVIRDSLHLQTVYKYVYQNPVSAGLSPKVESYPYSSLRGILGQERFLGILRGPLGFPHSAESLLEWLNDGYGEAQMDRVRRGLKGPEFEMPPVKSSRRRADEGLDFRTYALRFKKVDGTFG